MTLSDSSVVCETPRLVLKRPDPSLDAEFMLRLLNEDSFIRNIGDRGVRTRADAERYIVEGPLAVWTRHDFGLCRVETKDDATPIGVCGLLRREFLDAPDIGFAFFPEYWGKGYAFESAVGAIRHARETVNVERILGIVSPGNASSVRVLDKLGLRFSRRITLPNETDEVELYEGTTAAAAGGE